MTYFIIIIIIIKLKAIIEPIMHYINRLKSISIFFKMYKKKNELKIKTTTKQQNNKTKNKHWRKT